MTTSNWITKHQVTASNPKWGGWRLHYQGGAYHHSDGSVYAGTRFVWEGDDGRLRARGPARIPSLAILMRLIAQSLAEGWGHLYDGADNVAQEMAA